ncbi:serine/threonine-protein kinase bud32 [Xylographa opegraphella]|nr:serine/threonine-protein kinase bud32 [Xylographa opegraphella]
MDESSISPDLVPCPTRLSTPLDILPPTFNYIQDPPRLITQGAEAILYRTHFLTSSHICALKYRPSKSWRHPALDVRLTRHRILSEARTLVRCRREGVSVPAILGLDWEGGEVAGRTDRRSGGWMMMEWIEGDTVRNSLNRWLRAKNASLKDGFEWRDTTKAQSEDVAVELMRRIGCAIGRMHEIGVIHGDLTTSNLMLRNTKQQVGLGNGDSRTLTSTGTSLDSDVVLIDFGLATQSVQDEDKAVDLYVLERAFGSTHPTAEKLFNKVLEAYGLSHKGAPVVLRRLEDVRMRGRKRSMLG